MTQNQMNEVSAETYTIGTEYNVLDRCDYENYEETYLQWYAVLNQGTLSVH